MNFSLRDRIFDFILIVFIFFVVMICLIPFIHVASVSLSSNHAIMSEKVRILPIEFNLEAYSQIFRDKTMLRSLWFTALITVIYTVASMFMTICAAYPLTKKRLKGRNFILLLIVITMYFSGGMIPNYILIQKLGLLNKMWVLIVPGLIGAHSMIILKTFFTTSIPESIEESAYLDGCTDVGILLKIVLPLSVPVLATLSLFYAVARWNGFMDALMYITNSKMYPLQLKLYQIVYNSMSLEVTALEGSVDTQLTPEGLKAASIMFATIPILLVYPWLQRYFVKGIMIGAIKG